MGHPVLTVNIRNVAEQWHLLPKLVIWLTEIWWFKFDVFLPIIYLSTCLINMRQTSNVAQNMNETTRFGTIFGQDNDFPWAVTYLECEFIRYCQKEIGLENRINGNDGVWRTALPEEQFTCFFVNFARTCFFAFLDRTWGGSSLAPYLQHSPATKTKGGKHCKKTELYRKNCSVQQGV